MTHSELYNQIINLVLEDYTDEQISKWVNSTQKEFKGIRFISEDEFIVC